MIMRKECEQALEETESQSFQVQERLGKKWLWRTLMDAAQLTGTRDLIAASLRGMP